MSEASAPRLAARGITKRFPGVLALDAVDLELEPGEILAVIGENGAGKSTLMKVLDGIHAPDAGTLEWQGRPLVIRSPREARERGIALIHQELELAENLTVAENLFLGCEPRDRLGLLDRSLMARRAGELLARIEADFAPGTPVAGLAPGQRQMVEIARALGTEAEVLIFDEPTSSLSQRETELLFRLIRELRDANRSVVYISHALTEVERLADRVLVLRDGSAVGTFARGELDKQGMVRAMVGRDLGQARQRSAELGAVRLSVEGLVSSAFPESGISFELAAGEKLGLAGLVGAGRSELIETLFGVRPALGGSIRVDGAPLAGDGGPRGAIAAGLALVPEDRKRAGLFLESTVRENLALCALPRDASRPLGARGPGFIDHPSEELLVRRSIERLGIRVSGPEQVAQLLSGGNQQKVVLGRWLALEPGVLILDEPTRGIDVGARQEIYGLLDELSARGVAILFASSEMEEVLTLADRVLVLRSGAVAGELTRDELDEESVLSLATGAHEGDAA